MMMMMIIIIMEQVDVVKVIIFFTPTKPMISLIQAEALYNMGEFERALVQYERGTRVRKVTTVIIISLAMTIMESIMIGIIIIVVMKMQTYNLLSIRTRPWLRECTSVETQSLTLSIPVLTIPLFGYFGIQLC